MQGVQWVERHHWWCLWTCPDSTNDKCSQYWAADCLWSIGQFSPRAKLLYGVMWSIRTVESFCSEWVQGVQGPGELEWNLELESGHMPFYVDEDGVVCTASSPAKVQYLLGLLFVSGQVVVTSDQTYHCGAVKWIIAAWLPVGGFILKVSNTNNSKEEQ